MPPVPRCTLLALALGLALAAATPAPARAQGQDSTPAARHLLVMAELLPGHYDNVNQYYFDQRRRLPEADRHVRVSTTITRVAAPAFGPYVFLWVNATQTPDGERRSWRLATLSAADGADDEVVMRHYLRLDGEIRPEELVRLAPADLRRTEGCDYYFERRADHFRGTQRPRACRFGWDGAPVYTDNTIELSATSLWWHDHKYRAADDERITGVASGEPFWLERARDFHCYVDMPGVGGGRDAPFRRWDGLLLHDKGGEHWFDSAESPSRRLGIRLQAVTWHLLNEANGYFNRDSLVLYVTERLADGSSKEHGYAFTDADARRIGLNLKWLLANCALTPRDRVRPAL